MNNSKYTYPALSVLSLAFFGGLTLYLSSAGSQTAQVEQPAVDRHAAAPVQPHASWQSMTFTERQALRLKARLQAQHTFTPSVKDLAAALEERNELLKREITVTFTAEDGKAPQPWTVRMTEVPTWIAFSYSATSPSFSVSREAIEQYLRTAYIPQLPMPRSATVLSLETDKLKVTRAKTDAIATAGYIYDVPQAAAMLAAAITRGEPATQWNVSSSGGTLTYVDGGKTYTLTLLASGLSDYSNSPDNRIWNVHKVFDERLQGVVVQPGEVFGFVGTLGGPVTLEAGWKEALGLFGGGAAMTPGAGICQGATTVYRGALLSGLPIVHKRNHSLFVDHYEKYGIGLDATIFPGFHDLEFRNDTAGPIVLQTYLSGDDAIVNVYGIDDGRSVTMEGPYFASTAKQHLKRFGRAGLTNHEIAWIRTVHKADGTSDEELITARYAKPLWHSLMAKYIGNDRSSTELHAAAPSPIE